MCINIHIYIYTRCHIYIYMLWCYYLGQVWPFEVLLSGPSLLFYKTLFVKKHYKIGVSTLFLKRKWFEVLLPGPSWPFLSCLLGPDNNTSKWYFLFFAFLKMCWNTYFDSVFEHQPKLEQKMGQKNDNFSHFAKHRFIKNRFVATPLLTKNWGFSTLIFWNQKHWCWTRNIT